MKIIKPNVERIIQAPEREGLLKHIELCGRVSYKSEDKITEDSAEKFLNMLMAKGHTSPLEHATFYLRIPYDTGDEKEANDLKLDLVYNKYTSYYFDQEHDVIYFAANARVLANSKAWYDGLWKYVVNEDEEFIRDWVQKRYTFKFTCSRAIANEFVRHRVFSFTQESTRYCNYTNNKFGNELTFIEPAFLREERKQRDPLSVALRKDDNYTMLEAWVNYHFGAAENTYKCLVNNKDYPVQLKPEEARDFLPLALKTELVMTGSLADWNEFIKLRSAKSAHPDARVLSDRVKRMLAEDNKKAFEKPTQSIIIDTLPF